MKSKGAVYLVGAGPGDAGLLTLRGAELLGRADVVVYDTLVNPELLRFVPASAEIIRRPKRAEMPQAELTALLIAKAREGKTVVRLKGGDPFIFGRGAEEAEELAAAKIPFEVVPGISSITAVPNYAGIPLTHRALCSSFTVFTGHAEATETATDLQYAQIAKIPGTKVVLMGTERLEEWTQSLIQHGMAPETPIAIIRWGTTGRQQAVSGTLATIAKLAAEAKITPPALTIVGEVVTLRKKLNWFEQRPLFGKRVVVTRAKAQAAELSHRLFEQGAEVLEIPVIQLGQPANQRSITEALLELNSYEWLIFTSANGVSAFFEMFFKIHNDVRDIGGMRFAAVGPATAAKLKELHLNVDLMPGDYLAAEVAKAFKNYQNIENVKMCLLRAEVATPDLPKALEELGAIVDDIPVYRTMAETAEASPASESLVTEGADWLTFTSGSTVNHFHERFDLPGLLKKFPKIRVASIGPETTKALAKLELKPAVEAKIHTMEGLVAALLKCH